MSRLRAVAAMAFAWSILASLPPSDAGSLSDLLGRFDDQTLGQMSKPIDSSKPVGSSQAGDWGKLIYRLDRISGDVFAQRSDDSAVPPNVGDAVSIEGVIEAIESFPLPDDLVDLLEMRQISVVRLNVEDQMADVVTTNLPEEATSGDRVTGFGVFVGASNDPKISLYAAGRLSWSPRVPASPTQSVLSRGGIDLPRFAEAANRQRQRLSAADSDLFFKMIRIAGSVTTDPQSDAMEVRNSATPVQPLDLLKEPESWTGRWIVLSVETVRWTRIAVQDARRRAEVGADFYFEIDAIGDLGKTQLRIDIADGPPVVIENRFPVTLVSATLPPFLAPKDDPSAERTLSHKVSTPVQTSGFFYRLWSYESEFMDAQNAGDQFAPLIFVGEWTDRRSSIEDPAGVRWIGVLAAVGTVFAFIGVLLWNWKNRQSDRVQSDRRSML